MSHPRFAIARDLLNDNVVLRESRYDLEEGTAVCYDEYFDTYLEASAAAYHRAEPGDEIQWCDFGAGNLVLPAYLVPGSIVPVQGDPVSDRVPIYGSNLWTAPEEAGRVIRIQASQEKVIAECEHGIYEILPDGSSVGVTF